MDAAIMHCLFLLLGSEWVLPSCIVYSWCLGLSGAVIVCCALVVLVQVGSEAVFGGKARSTPPQLPTSKAPQAWPRYYYLDIDYLEVAKAALRCAHAGII